MTTSDTLQTVSRFGLLTAQDPGEDFELGKLRDLALRVDQILNDFNAELIKLRESGELSDKGLDLRARAAAIGANDRLDRAESHLSNLEGMIAERRDDLVGSLKVGAELDRQAMRYELERAELVRKFAAMDSLQVQAEVYAAIDRGEHVVVDALLNSPAPLNRLSDEVLDQAREAWVEARDPERAEAVRQAEDAATSIRGAIEGGREMLARWIRS